MADAKHFSRLTNRLLGLAVAVACIAAPGTARATHTLLDFQSALEALWEVDPSLEPPPDNGSRDFAVGGFQGPVDDNNFGFSAHSGPLGQDPRGHLSETIHGEFQGRFKVTCLRVVGKMAAMGLVPTDNAANDAAAQFVLSVFDSGLPGGAGDRFALIETSAATCAAFVGIAAAGGSPLEHGNISVHDVML
jgi:hypothetical protein